ncbi:TlpA family protein disulfide reductase [Roseomonas sp. BN140053]|uniref:TlpA family protein disulfide reductase n=1 Tax=Roseomonas sp. BN140053 TaxID=3391898 RepID=UPI0039E85743
MALPARPARAQSPNLGRLMETPPRPLPAFTFTDAEGDAKSLADFTGQSLLLNFWATWCPPCVAEMPALDRLQAALGGEGLKVLPLSSDRGGRTQVEPFYAARRLTKLGIWLDPRGAAGRALGLRGLPTTVLVDRQGQERARLEGSTEWDRPDMLATIRRLILAPATPGQPAAPGQPTAT